MKIFKIVISSLFAFVVAIAVNLRVTPLVPPLADVFSPIYGLWRNLQKTPLPVNLKFDGLTSPVFVYQDEDSVFHINVENPQDAAFVQGWLHAREFLWVMEFGARVGLGESAEIVGPKTLEYDLLMVRSGMRQSAQKTLDHIKKDPESWQAIQSYAAGVNTWVESLSRIEYPPEYKFFGFSPRKWEPIHTVAIFKLMGLMLSGATTDAGMSRALKVLTDDELKKLYPLFPSNNHPIVNKKKWKKPSFPPPEPVEPFFRASDPVVDWLSVDPDSGSNSWAIGPQKTDSGYTIVSNDTHLRFQLPAIWQMMQITGPNWNVFGASLIGAPSIVLGHTEDVAWAFTNAVMDGIDFYEIKLSLDKSHYVYEGSEIKLDFVKEKINVRGQSARMEEIPWTHHGPIVFPIDDFKTNDRRWPRGTAMRWVGHEASNELMSFLRLNQAKTIEDCELAIRTHMNPAQNIICADRKHISITQRGRMPIKWNRQGMAISDGTSKAYEWGPSIPHDELPYAKDPEEGFVCSANNHPVNETYPYYLNFYYAAAYRNQRIREQLQSKNDWDIKSNKALQNDTFNHMAKDAVPVLVGIMDGWKETTEFEKWAADVLRFWDLRADKNSVAATLFIRWFPKIEAAAWQGLGRKVWYPDESVLIERLKNQEKLYFKTDASSEMRQLLSDVRAEMESKFGSQRKSWKWGRFKDSRMSHVTRLPNWGSKDMNIGGSRHTILSHKGWHGPNWKIVVEFTKRGVKSEAIVAGGVSGNPLRPEYTEYLKPWSQGKLIPINFLKQDDWLGLRAVRMEPSK